MYFPNDKEFLNLTKEGNLIPVYKEISGDLDTPVSAYMKLAAGAKFSFLLESVEGEEKVARFSFLAKDPELVLQSKDKEVSITKFQGKKSSVTKKHITSNPLEFIREILSPYKFVPVSGLPRFCGGMVGYLSYDTVRFFEKLPHNTKDDLKLPDTLLILAKNLVIFDHRNHKIKVLNCVHIPENSSKTDILKKYKAALKTIDQTIAELNKPLKIAKTSKSSKKFNVKSNVTEKEFTQMVEKAKEEIRAGEIIQVVLSQRFQVNLPTSPLNVYRSLRAINPSPYMYYLNFGDVKIIGSSPELLVRVEDGIVETRPIAGTRRRGKDDSEDDELAKDLLNDPKEKAEHIMLVDLGRNDLGRVCAQGTVQISEFMQIEKYSHVMHIISNVKGKLRNDQDAFDVLKAAFPAGTVSGAPKIRAMEIIDSLEKIDRGPYAGCIGYFSFSGNLDTCITIRTIVAYRGSAYVQAGAGIVADSDPIKEYQETVNKAKAQIKAIQLASERN